VIIIKTQQNPTKPNKTRQNSTKPRKMKVFVFDTETSGLPKERNPSIYDTDKWPHIMQISYIIYNTETGELEETYDAYIRLNPWVIVDPVSEGIHGITREIMEAKGVPIQEALVRVRDALSKVDICVGHNVSFDKRFMIVEGIRNSIRMNFPADYCTMKNSKEVCKIEYTFSNGDKGFKYPKLMELYEHLFPGIPAPQNLHNSFADTIITLKCYCKLAHGVNMSLESREFRALFRENCC
jgi:DNA polymerase III epsilon subunit-like protein